ncbi:MAG TPA: ATP-dependent DNA helicase RecG [Candidatus Eisenbacteria bacterium]|nr:ATP-dependent DNA helicase RecG [Candidatus Eisenbacteria bacterium]
MKLSTLVVDAGRLYANYAKRLEKLEIFTLKDFLYHLPTRYEDYSNIVAIQNAIPGEIATIQGQITEITNNYTRSHKQIQRARLTDDTGSLSIIWFNQPYITKTLKFGDKVSVSGRVESDNGILQLISPDFELIPESGTTIHTGRLVPVYPETQGVSSKWLRRQVFKILEQNRYELEEFLPDFMIKNLGFMELHAALSEIHFPNTLPLAEKARARLGFDEVFLLQLANIQRKREWQEKVVGNTFAIETYKKEIDIFWEKLPFEPTNAQRRAIHEIFADFTSTHAMNRLLEGDVGSGKTVVAAIAMYLSYLNGFQAVLMAPTEILANQHYTTIKSLLEPLGVKVDLATGSKKTYSSSSERSKSRSSEDSSRQARTINSFDILIGTHAVLSEKINYEKLGLVVIDEQHRFGVEQRSIIRSKGTNPHVLTMTATPIPRTVALTVYGDLELSVLDEMPKGRQIVKTWLVPAQKREAGYIWIEEQVKKGDQVFIVCPFIEESESLTTIKAASTEFERLQKHIFPKLRLGLLHGKMRPKEKDGVLEEFRKGTIDILVATPVVEVGIDIPNATIILIEAAERFGLSQLHQLRGRVGRGDKQSYCLLFTESSSLPTTNRLKSLEHIHNGAELAELDLKMRGAGELYGTMQHGRKWLKIASFGDTRLLEISKQEAIKVFPTLTRHPLLLEKVMEASVKQVSPD